MGERGGVRGQGQVEALHAALACSHVLSRWHDGRVEGQGSPGGRVPREGQSGTAAVGPPLRRRWVRRSFSVPSLFPTLRCVARMEMNRLAVSPLFRAARTRIDQEAASHRTGQYTGRACSDGSSWCGPHTRVRPKADRQDGGEPWHPEPHATTVVCSSMIRCPPYMHPLRRASPSPQKECMQSGRPPTGGASPQCFHGHHPLT